MDIKKLVYMANQIGKYFAPQGEAAAIDGVVDHLKRFWEPRMRAEIVAHAQAGGEGLDEIVRKAVARLS